MEGHRLTKTRFKRLPLPRWKMELEQWVGLSPADYWYQLGLHEAVQIPEIQRLRSMGSFDWEVEIQNERLRVELHGLCLSLQRVCECVWAMAADIRVARCARGVVSNNWGIVGPEPDTDNHLIILIVRPWDISLTSPNMAGPRTFVCSWGILSIEKAPADARQHNTQGENAQNSLLRFWQLIGYCYSFDWNFKSVQKLKWFQKILLVSITKRL